ncbi:glycosyltransferase [Candidatus Peregrinibacteria bacterium]|nr:MAG: glycosyltransferase [Candidatus Peregrinibacteria bacterium]
MKTSHKNVSIIIITFNEEDNILKILQDLKRQSFKNFEIIVSDSNSSDNTEKNARTMMSQFSEFRFENCSETLGPSHGRNFGVTFAKYERLLFLDADTRIHDIHFLRKFMSITNRLKIEAGSMYPRLSTKHLMPKIGYKLMNAGFFITQYFSPTACGSCMFSTKTMHKSIGGFSEDVFLCEDCDYVRNGKKHGFKTKMAPLHFEFSDRRLQQDGFLRTGAKYLTANVIRFVTGKSVNKRRLEYKFGHYLKK